MACHGDGGKCLHEPPCEHACAMRVQALQSLDDDARPHLQRIGQQIGYGNAQHILGQFWDEMLHAEYGVGAGRGQMGVTATEREAYRRGWEACMQKWADHMKRMAKAIK